MIEDSSGPLRVELLQPNHFRILSNSKAGKNLPWLQTMLFYSLLTTAEKNLPDLLPAKHPFCLVAIEDKKPIALLEVKPNNRRATCWLLTTPIIFEHPKHCSIRTLNKRLLKTAIEHRNTKAQSWIIKLEANETDQIALTRELGFQPLKVIKNWEKIQRENNDESISRKTLTKEHEWQAITRSNAQILWSLEQSGESIHLRQILDRQWIDLLDEVSPNSGVLISVSNNTKKAIAGLLCHYKYNNFEELEFIRDVALDSRLLKIIPIILDNFTTKSRRIVIATSSIDNEINNLLNSIGWEQKGEKILLGRSLWKRKLNTEFIPGKRSLEGMLGRLNPQQPPLPTPLLPPR